MALHPLIWRVMNVSVMERASLKPLKELVIRPLLKKASLDKSLILFGGEVIKWVSDRATSEILGRVIFLYPL